MAAAITGDRDDVTSDCFNASSHTGQRFTPTYSAFKRRDLKCREGCAPLASEKGAVEMGGKLKVSTLPSVAWSMGWLGSNITIGRHFVGHHVKVSTLVQRLLLYC